MSEYIYPKGLRGSDAEAYYVETVAKLEDIDYYNPADERLIVRYCNELVELEELRKDVEDNSRVQIAKSGYEQKSVYVQNYNACMSNLLSMEKELMLTPYQRKKGNTAGKHKRKKEDDELEKFL